LSHLIVVVVVIIISPPNLAQIYTYKNSKTPIVYSSILRFPHVYPLFDWSQPNVHKNNASWILSHFKWSPQMCKIVCACAHTCSHMYRFTVYMHMHVYVHTHTHTHT